MPSGMTFDHLNNIFIATPFTPIGVYYIVVQASIGYINVNATIVVTILSEK